jgi:hypothetical protein
VVLLRYRASHGGALCQDGFDLFEFLVAEIEVLKGGDRLFDVLDL